MKVELRISPNNWVSVKHKNRREFFTRPFDFKLNAGGKAACIVYSRRAAIRLASAYNEKITGEWIRKHFPYGEKLNDTTHVFGYEKMGASVVFMAALPLTVINDACDICESIGIKRIDILRIDLIERLLFAKNLNRVSERWVCFPLDGGIRVLSVSKGQPAGAFLLSGDPDFQKTELTGLSMPDEAVVFDGCDWLKTVLHEAHVRILEGGSVIDAV